jgi:glycosyltransferase involved in cell wall biosynthesis
VTASNHVSVVIPAFNAASYLGAALGSVLAQTQPPDEIVVVDDGSRDDTAAVAQSFPGVRLVARSHGGIAAARNAGVAATSREWIAFLDADDLWLPDKLERQFAHMAASPDACGAFGWLRAFVSPDLPAETRARFDVDLAPAPGYHASTLVIAREAFEGVGTFDEDLSTGEFIDWAARARDRALVLPMIQDVVALRRVHGANTVLTARGSLGTNYLKLVRARRKGLPCQ